MRALGHNAVDFNDQGNNLLTVRTKLGRHPERGRHEREEIYRILDEGFICHVGFVADGQPFVVPTAYGRSGDNLFIHGSAASRMLRKLQTGVQVCLTVTLLDGLVLASSAFNHSMNYRSVMVFGTAALTDDSEEKLSALETISEHIVPGRWKDARYPTVQELKATSVLKLPLEEASAKVRNGPPKDEGEDTAESIWTGVLPVQCVCGTPIASMRSGIGVGIPEYVKNYSRTRPMNRQE